MTNSKLRFRHGITKRKVENNSRKSALILAGEIVAVAVIVVLICAVPK